MPLGYVTGMGIVAPNAVGVANYWHALAQGYDSSGPITIGNTHLSGDVAAAEVKNFSPQQYLGSKGLRNLDRSALLLLAAASQAIDDAKLVITPDNTDDFGVCTGTTFSHFLPIVEFDREVFEGGLSASNPALFPSTVVNAASSHVSIRFNIQGFNTTVSTGYTSALESLRYSLGALDAQRASVVLSSSVDVLSQPLLFGLHTLGYMAGITGPAISCPYDTRRNGPVPAEASAVVCLEHDARAVVQRGGRVYAEILGTGSYFDGYKQGKVHPQGLGLQIAIVQALNQAGVDSADIDYISTCANSSVDLDCAEVFSLRKVFGRRLDTIPASAIKSMTGETFSASGGLQIIACIGSMHTGIVPATIHIEKLDARCQLDCVPNTAQKKDVKLALVLSSGPGGYNSACVLGRAK